MSPRRALLRSPCAAIARTPLLLHLDGAPSEAWAFAQASEGATWDHYRSLAVSDDETYAMQYFAERLRLALAEQGYAPR